MADAGVHDDGLGRELRSAPTMAVYGLTCAFLYIVPAIVFLLPQSLVAAKLASGWTGGVFVG